jgi:hypothetical protein
VKTLELLSNQVTYRGFFIEPIFGVSSDRAGSLRITHEEFKRFNMKAGDLRFQDTGAIQDQHVAVIFGIGHCKVAVDRVEASFSEFTNMQVPEIAMAMEATQNVARKLSPETKFSSHHLTYNCHARVEGSTFRDFVESLPAPSISVGGESLGIGFCFNWREPHRGWRTKLTLDGSLAYNDALFLSFNVDIVGDELKVTTVWPEGAGYFGSILAELGLRYPEQDNANAGN